MDVDVAAAAELFADPARAAMVAALLDGHAHTAGELARQAGVAASTASSHLARLRAAGLLQVTARGRHRDYALTDERVGRAFEALAALAPARPVRSLRQSRVAGQLRLARTCYDHLAGVTGVALTDALLRRGDLVAAAGAFTLTPGGERRLGEFGLDVEGLRRTRRSFAHPCLDWSERRGHLAGALGAGLLHRMLELSWLHRTADSRAVRLSPTARSGLREVFGCQLPD